MNAPEKHTSARTTQHTLFSLVIVTVSHLVTVMLLVQMADDEGSFSLASPVGAAALGPPEKAASSRLQGMKGTKGWGDGAC